jgi:ELWxxDGT repeat protein
MNLFKKCFLLPVLFHLFVCGVSAQQAFKLGEINKTPVPFGSSPENFTVFDGKLVFSADTREYGRELWMYDGSNPAVLLADINKGKEDSDPEDMCVADGKLYFSAKDKAHGEELWCYDGEKVYLVVDLIEGTKSSRPSDISPYKKGFAFMAIKSDGADALFYFQEGEPLKNLMNYPISSSKFAGDNKSGKLLVQHDFITSDINFTDLGRELAIIIDTSGQYLNFDIVKEAKKGSSPTCFTTFKDKVYVALTSPKYGRELFRVDSINAGLLYDSNPGVASGNPKNIRVLNDSLWFEAKDSLGNDMIYVFDGSKGLSILNEEGDWNSEIKLKDIMGSYHGSFFMEKKGSQPRGFGSNLKTYDYYDEQESTSSYYGKSLNFYNRGANTQQIIKGENEYLDVDLWNGTCIFKDNLVFCANNGQSGNEMWFYNEKDGARLACDIAKGSRGAGVKEMHSLDNCIVFIADDGVHGKELWKVGKSGIPELLADIKPGIESSNLNSLVVLNNCLYFQAEQDDEVNIWVYDGNQKPYLLNRELKDDPFLWAGDLSLENNALCFSGQKENGPVMQWTYDGSHAPQVKKAIEMDEMRIYFDKEYSSELKPEDEVVIGKKELLKRFLATDKAVFDREAYSANNTKIVNCFSREYGFEPWVYSDNALPTLLKDFASGSENSNFTILLSFDDRLCFSTMSNDSISFWSYNGKEQPKLEDRFPAYYLESNPVKYNNKIYFEYNILNDGAKLYTWDGKGSIQFVMDFNRGWRSDMIKTMFVSLGQLFFVAEDDSSNDRLWQFNGEGQPSLVPDIDSPRDEIDPNNIYYNDNYIVFVAEDANQEQVWVYDGKNKPIQVSAFTNGPYDTHPRNFVINNHKLFFTANDGIDGSEIWCCPLK